MKLEINHSSVLKNVTKLKVVENTDAKSYVALCYSQMKDLEIIFV
jgi:hypothetical protein